MVFAWGRTCLLRSSFITSGDPGRVIYQVLDMRNNGGREIRTHDQRPMVLPTTPFVKALVHWATCKRLTNRLPKLSLITITRGHSNRNPRWTQKTLLLQKPCIPFLSIPRCLCAIFSSKCYMFPVIIILVGVYSYQYQVVICTW